LIQSLVGGGVGSVLFATLKDTLILVDVSFVLLSQSSESVARQNCLGADRVGRRPDGPQPDSHLNGDENEC
jgi:hypothetical protein